MNTCQICAKQCHREICHRCKNNHTAIIKRNVANHSNIEYDVVKSICEHFKCTDNAIFGTDVNYPARDLYVFVMVRNIGWRCKKVGEILNIPKSNVSRIMAKMSAKFRSEINRNKYQSILNLK